MTPLLATLTTKTGVLHGTLVIPSGAKSPIPVALLIAGSGPTDHVLKQVRESSQQTASYSDPALPLHPRLVESIAKFVGQ